MKSAAEQQQESKAVFFSADYYWTNDLRMNVAGRYTQETKDFLFSPFTTCPNDNPGVAGCSVVEADSSKWTNFSPKAGLDYQFTDDTFGYFTTSLAFRSGGYNARAFNIADIGPYDPEEVFTLELGLKTEMADGRVRLNSAIFRNKFKDLQRENLFGPGATRIVNAAEGTIQGLEMELTALITQDFRIYANASYLDATYGDYVVDLNGDGATEDVFGYKFCARARTAIHHFC